MFTGLFFSSCGVLLDDAKFRGLWHLQGVKYYEYNEEFNSYLAVEGIDDTSPDTVAPIIGNFFDVKMSDITMLINTNKTWTAKGYPVGYTAAVDIVSDSDSGKWEIDTYNNTVTLTCPKGDDNTTDKLWSKNRSVTNAWPMSTNNKFDFYIKASDFDREYFEFEISEKPVPDRIEKERLDNYLSDKDTRTIKNEDGESVSVIAFCMKWYILDDSGQYYYLKNSISVDDKYKMYKILTIEEDDLIKFEYQATTRRFYAMEGYFVRDGYQD